jgi:glycosyltransferase involved in cell wall biosynthesis
VKILHVIPSVSLTRGGTTPAIIDMVHALQHQNLDVTIATTNDDGDHLMTVDLEKKVIHRGIPTYFFPRFSPNSLAIREFNFSFTFTTWLFQNIAKYDLIHLHGIFSYTTTIAMVIARFQKISYLTTPHGMLCEWSLQQRRQKKQAYLSLIEKANLDHAQAIHLTCQQECDDLTALDLKAPTFILPLALTEMPQSIPNAGDRLRQSLNCPTDEPIILFLSRLHYKKGLDYLIPALAQFRDQQFTFVIAGSGTPAYEAEIQTLVNASGLGDRTQMVGFVEGERKDLLIQGADLFALTSHSENFGVAVLEALIAGKPVLITPGVGLVDIVREHDLGYVADLNIDSIIHELDQYFADPDRAKQKGDRAHQFTIANYTWDKIANDLVQVYQSIVDQQPIPLLTAKTPTAF